MFNIIKKHKNKKHLNYIDKIKFLLNASEEVFNLKPEDNIYEYVANKLNKFVGNSIIIVNSADKDINHTKVEAIAGLGDKFSYITSLLGMNPIGKQYKMTDEARHEISKFRLSKIENGIHNLSFETIPKNISQVIEKAIGLKEIYGIGLVKNKVIFGSVVIIIRENNSEIDLDLLESFIKIFAIAIKSKIDEDNLIESKREVEKINRFSVGREIEMVRLKKEIEELKNRIRDI